MDPAAEWLSPASNAAAASAWTPDAAELAEIDARFPLAEDPAAKV